jgi:hypothetical protein
LEADFGWRNRNGNNGYSHLLVSGIYHWVWNLTEGLNWYVGPGAQVGFYSYKNPLNEEGISVGVGGQIGLEYDFHHLGAPILLGLDSRPMWGVVSGPKAFGYGAAFSLRYTFD